MAAGRELIAEDLADDDNQRRAARIRLLHSLQNIFAGNRRPSDALAPVTRDPQLGAIEFEDERDFMLPREPCARVLALAEPLIDECRPLAAIEFVQPL